MDIAPKNQPPEWAQVGQHSGGCVDMSFSRFHSERNLLFLYESDALT